MSATKRYYLCPVVGTGTQADPYRAKLPSGMMHAAIIPTDASGKPLFAWALVQVSAADHSVLLADNTIDALPAIGLEESPAQTLSTAAKTALAARLVARGLTTAQAQALLSGTLRLLLRALGRHLAPAFDEMAFGVGG